MKYRIPLYISLVLSAIAVPLLYFDLIISAQVSLVLASLIGIVAFKLRGGLASGITHFIPAAILAGLYYRTDVFPLLSIALVLAGLQNSFLEIFFPAKMYNNPVFKIIIGILSIGCYFFANLAFPAGKQAWIFPGALLLFVNILSALIAVDVYNMKSLTRKGFISAGSPCPQFSLPNEAGDIVSAKDFIGKYLLLIFVRGDWCPGCHIMLRCYERNRAKFAERGVNLLSIGPDPLGVNKEMVNKLGLHYHILSDEKQLLGRQFCVELQKATKGQPEYDFIPLPASFLIDKEGIVRYTSRADVAGEILNPEDIFKVLDSLK